MDLVSRIGRVILTVRRCRSLIAAAVVLACTLGFLPCTAASASVTPSPRILGASLVPWFGTLDSVDGLEAIHQLKADSGNTLSIVLPLCQASLTSSFIWACPDMPSDASLIRVIKFARSIGLAVMLNMHIDVAGRSEWRAHINPAEPTAWFRNYGGWLVYYGRIAQAAGAGGICIGTEMIDVTNPTVHVSNTDMWVRYIIRPLRSVFTGWLTYSAQHGVDALQVGIWPYLDRIGVSVYFSLGGSGSLGSLIADWQRINKSYVSPLRRYHKPIFFTEVGYRNVAGDHLTPWSYAPGGRPDQTEQATDYKALLWYWRHFRWWRGVVWWDWSADPGHTGPADIDFTPQGKQAEAILRYYFAQR